MTPRPFQPSLILMTPALVQYIRQHPVSPAALLDRHVQGDWGTLRSALNERELLAGGVVTSCYLLSAEQDQADTAVIIETNLVTKTTRMLLAGEQTI
ncbi:hypothetical protein [Chitinimonas sp. BJB300]|uniref:hypothetical protein n=1 Tax=Chitinimonas sp. BJB300 TaxID=1559339 RepID=UPI000C0EBD2C|nr:hypothetical protein [Chitinimonas sp. BJB300]PHV11940.1 hypothetical protein CSQ89_08435 [Chitinimonas sp. BJB300]TSJ84466.1 hypothetical protein FG002_020175 [Chitinimonas sp. BJB300]